MKCQLEGPLIEVTTEYQVLPSELILVFSIAVQFAAGAVALQTAWSRRRLSWSLLALAILLMGLRRSLTFYEALKLDQPIDAGVEAIALLISTLVLMAVWGLRAETPSVQLESETLLKRTNRVAILFGALTVLGSVAIGFMAYTASRRSALGRTFEANLKTAMMLAHFYDLYHNGDEARTLAAIEEFWNDIQPLPSHGMGSGDGQGSGYLCIVRGDATLAVHTARPGAVGKSVGHLPLASADGGPQTLKDLANAPRPWAGRFTAADGEDQVVAFAPLTAIDGMVAVHEPLAEVQAHNLGQALPYIVGLAFITLGMLPISLLLLHRAYLSAEKKLRESQGRMKLVLEGTSDGMWDWDVTNGSIKYDDNWHRILGYDPGEREFDFAWWEEAVHPESRPVFQRALEAYLEGRTKYYELEYRIRPKHGDWKWIKARGISVARGADGRPTRMIGIHRDISRERALEQQLRQAQKMEAIGQLAGGVAHDFNNLLQIILMYLELAKERTVTEKEALEKIKDAAEKAADLTHRLLAFSRRQILQPVDLNLHQVLAELMKMLRRIIGEDIELRMVNRHDTEDYRVFADRSQLEEVILNLCLNARDAMPGGGTITLEVSTAHFTDDSGSVESWARPGDFVSLSVTDTGCGIPMETLDKVFEPFFTTKPMGEGTGLGLAMVSGIVEQHRGWMHVASEPGQGSTFRLYLPRSETPANGELPDQREPAPGEGETILLAEDEEQVRECAVRILRDAGYEVLAARHGAEAVKVFKQNAEDVSLVILDLVMPVMGGPKARDEIRRLDGKVRFLFSTGYSAPAVAGDVIRDTPVLTKPYSRADLLWKVREILEI